MMTKRHAVDFATDAIVLARKAPAASAYAVASTVATLSRLGTEAHTWAERLCNYGEPSEGADERKRASIRQRAETALKALFPMIKTSAQRDRECAP